MLTNHPYPFQQPTPDEVRALIQRAHAERSQAVRDLFLALFRRKPAADKAVGVPSLSAAHAAR
jgi:hypothetical protein